jgi:Mg2+ and Co2+ transporter CorA
MITDDQNRALYLFTGVTIVFLPLSFFTSYFGMNIADIRETEMEQSRFWAICGPVTAGLIFLIWCGIRIAKGVQQRTKLLRESSGPRHVK